MKIDDVVVFFHPETGNDFPDFLINCNDLIKVWIFAQD